MPKKKEESKVQIGNIGNYYGGLGICEENCRYYWSIKNCDGEFWEEITESLYLELLKFQDHLKAMESQNSLANVKGEII